MHPLEALHPEPELLDRLLNFLRFKKGPELPGTTRLWHGKVGGDKLSPNRDSRDDRLLGKEISSFLHQNIMGRPRNLRVSGMKR